MKFRKKPVVIEAVQVPSDDNPLAWGYLVGWFNSHKFQNWTVAILNGQKGLEIRTLEGTMRAEIGDWIIRGVKGEFYPCKPAIFDQTYDVSGTVAAEESLPSSK